MKETRSYPCPLCGYDPHRAPAQAHALRPGTILNGKYVVGTILGQGGFGITYVGWDLALESKVAIKEYFPSGQVVRSPENSLTLQWYTTPQAEAARNAGREMFLKEARKMSRVGAIPQVVRVRDLFQQNDTAYIVMDFVEGETLMARLKKTGPLSWDQAQSIFFPAIRAMEQVHQEGLIHRDLSPDNLMLLPNGDVRILDLGAAKDLTINSGASSMQVAKGGFSPLEQYTQRGGSGTWSDVYAMAATMYYSLTGVLPPASVDRVESDTIRWDLPALTVLPKPVLEGLKKAMAVFTKDRTQTMGALLAQLEKAQTKRKKKPAPKQKAKKKKSPLPVIAAVLAVALIAGGVPWPRDVSEPQMESRPQAKVPTETETVPETETTIPTEPESVFPLAIQEQTISAGYRRTIAIKEDGHAIAVGDNSDITGGAGYVSDWEDLVAVSTTYCHTIGLKSDGTVVTRGFSWDLSDWTDIVSVHTVLGTTLGLRSDGTVMAITSGFHSDVNNWENIVAIGAGVHHIVGLRADGTVVATDPSILVYPNGSTADHDYGQCDVSGWTDIVAICTSEYFHTVGLRADGTVVATGQNESGQCDVSDWTDIVAIGAGGSYTSGSYTIGLRADGTVVSTLNTRDFDVSDWTDIVAISAGPYHAVGLKADGTLMVTGWEGYGARNVSYWTDIRIPGTIK